MAVIYGPPTLGKTSLALTASKPAVLDFDNGSHRASYRAGKAILQVKDWKQIAEMKAEDFAEYDTIVIDTIGKCLEVLAADIMRSDPKAGRGGSLTLQGYGALKGRFRAWLNLLRTWGKDIVLVAHVSEETRGEDVVDRIDAMGSSKNEVFQAADLVGRIFITDQGSRMITFHPSASAYCKNVGTGIDPIALKKPPEAPEQMAEVLQQAKDLINAESAKVAGRLGGHPVLPA